MHAPPATRRQDALRSGATHRRWWARATESLDEPPLDFAHLIAVDWSVSYVAFLVYVFVVTTYRVPLGTVSLALALIALPLERHRLRIPLPLGIFGAFVLWNGFASLVTPFGSFNGEAFELVVKIWLVVFVGVNVVTNHRRLWFFVTFFLVCFATHPARGAIFNYVGGYRYWGRALWEGEFSNANQLAGLGLLQLSLAVSLLYTKVRGIIRWGALASVLVLPLLILLTQSRGVFIGMTVFGLVAFSGVIQRRVKVQMAKIAVVIVVGTIIFAPSSMWRRLGGLAKLASITTLVEADETGSAAARFTIWQTATQVIGAYPVTGVGMGAYPEANAVFAPEIGAFDVHSTYLNVLAEGGGPSLILFLMMLGSIYAHSRRSRRQLKAHNPQQAQTLWFLEAGLTGFLISAIWATMDGVQLFYLHAFILWMAAAVMSVNPRPRQAPRRRSVRTIAGS